MLRGFVDAIVLALSAFTGSNPRQPHHALPSLSTAKIAKLSLESVFLITNLKILFPESCKDLASSKSQELNNLKMGLSVGRSEEVNQHEFFSEREK